jgi:NAD(P)-dependent dehydrogenase (short-subunit alcohol dehydrogenase family)
MTANVLDGGRLAGKVAVVTGAASGIGAGIAERFAGEGATVVLTDRLADEGATVAGKIAAAGGRARFVALDVTDEEGWSALAANVAEVEGRLDVLVNSAGVGTAVGGGQAGSRAFHTLMEVNATGTMLAIRTAVGLMRERGGSIVTIGSIAGVVATGDAAINVGYHGSKAAVRLMTRAFAAQEGAHGIRVNCILPGVMPPMRGSRLGTDPDRLAALLRRVPLGRTGATGDVAAAALFLASDDAAYITGVDLPVDGGFLAL